MTTPNLQALCPALLVIDSQCEFVTTGESAGAIATEDSTDALAKVTTLITAAHDADMPVIFTQEAHRKECVDFGRELDGDEGVHCIEGTHGVAFRPETQPRDGDFVVPKRRYSGFFATDLDLLLRGLGVDTLLICGFVADVCVHYTAVDAHQYDYHVFVAQDGTTGTSPEAGRAALAAIDYLQDGSVVTSQDLIAGMRAGFKLSRAAQTAQGPAVSTALES
jgi:nicotinamidase-related amidase